MLKIASTNKLQSAILLSLITLPLTNIQAEIVKVESNIKEVTVYPGSAKITRVSKVSLSPGNNEIVIKNLPVNLNETSLRVTGEGQGSISLGSVELSRDIQQDVVQEQEKSIRIRIEETQENRKAIEDSITRNNSQLEYIRKMVLGSNNINKRKDEGQNNSYVSLPLEKWTEAWKTLDEATKRVQEEIRESKKALKDVDKVLNKLNRELQQVATNQKEYRSAKLTIDSETSTELDLNLIYQINGARWEPVYDMDLNTETGAIKMKTLAQISQRTGEDWKGVDVTLSTLRPSAGTQLPQLDSWVLDFMPEQPEAYSSGMAMDSIALESMPAPSPTMVRKPKTKKKVCADATTAK